jgi:hypothetical protein
VTGQPASGLSIRAWCDRQAVTEASFYAWRRVLADRGVLRSAREKNRRARLVAVEVVGAANTSVTGSPLQLVVGDMRVEVSAGFDEGALRRLVSVLRETASC